MTEQSYPLYKIQEAEEKALAECSEINALVKESASGHCGMSCRLERGDCSSHRVSTYLQHGTLKKPERDEELVKALERVMAWEFTSSTHDELAELFKELSETKGE